MLVVAVGGEGGRARTRIVAPAGVSRSEPLVGELMLCHEEERRGSYLELGTEAKYRHGAWARAQ